MKYEIIKGKINGKLPGDIIELSEEIWKRYGEKYLRHIVENKEVKNSKNKAFTTKEATTKDE